MSGTDAPSSLLDELDERPEGGLGVDEGDGGAAGAGAGGLVDDAPAGVLDGLEGGGAVGHAIADVVDALALLLEEGGDGRVEPAGGEQLDVGLRHLEQRLLDAVALDDL